MSQYDWTQPQRQPVAGLLVVFVNTFFEVFKRTWPFLVIILLGKKGSGNRYEIYALIFLAITIISAIFKFIYFKFHIEQGKLVIKSGWLKKETKVIPLESIQTVHVEQGPVHSLLNIVKISIDTAGSQKTEVTIDALREDMAMELRKHILVDKKKIEGQPDESHLQLPLIRLTTRDLFKLSISANHIETFLILLSFGFGMYENLKDIDNDLFDSIEKFVPRNAIYPILVMVTIILFITVLVSTAIIFFRFYNFRVFKRSTSFYIHSGLMNVKEKMVPIQKIQYVSWRANWTRKLMRLWMLEYHIAGGVALKTQQRVQIPITQDTFIPVLVDAYHSFPVINDQKHVRIHPSFVWRQLLMKGIIPSLMVIPILWLIWQERAAYFIAYPILVGISAWLQQKKFRLWSLGESAFIKRGSFGERRILFEWYKIQSVALRQSFFQRRKKLATVILQTAAGRIVIPFIDLNAAREIINYSVYKAETSSRPWV